MTIACCCGTTRIVLTITMTRTRNSASATISEPINVSGSGMRASWHGTMVGEDEHRAAHRSDIHRPRLRRVRRGKLGVPARAAGGDPRRAIRAPAQHLHLRSDVERLLPPSAPD